MNDAVIALDPGKSGGVAWENNSGTGCAPMPDNESEIAALLREVGGKNARVVLEHVGGYAGGPGQPGSAMFTFGRNFGALLGICAALKWRTELVRPQQWQKTLGLGNSRGMTKSDWKNKLKGEALRLWPELPITLKTADAVLLLEYAKRKH